MRRCLNIFAVLLIAAPLAGQAPAPAPTPARTVKLADHLYEITAFDTGPIGVKVLALVATDGVLLVDTGTAQAAAAVRAALDALGAGPVRFVVNTHYHDDHVGGNPALAKDAIVIAHDAVGRRLTTGLALLAPPAPGRAPTITFDRTMTLRFGGEEVRLVHRSAAHTDGDTTVEFVHAGVVAVGDLIFPDRFPFIDMNAGGTVPGYLATLAALASEYPEGTRFVAAHGAIYSAAQVAAYRKELVAMDEKVKAALAAGSTADRMARDGVLGAWPEWGTSFITPERFINTLVAAERPAAAARYPSVLDRLVPALVTGHGEDAVRLYGTLKVQKPPQYTFGEDGINRLGYTLLAAGRTEDAIAIFTLNVREHPKSWNVYDSLGEAYMTAGKRDLAVDNYSRSLALNPANDNASQMLQKLQTPQR